MNINGCAIIQRPNEWLIVIGDQVEHLASNVSPTEIAVCADLMSKLAGIKNPQAILAPDSTSCYFASLSGDPSVDEPSSGKALTRTLDRAALTYELEDHLPIDAEAMVADFAIVPTDDGQRRVSGIAITTERWQQIAEELESVGISVRTIVPRAILMTRALSESTKLADDVQLLLVDGDQCDAIDLRQNTVAQWKHFHLDAAKLERHKLLDGQNSDEVVVAGTNDQSGALIAATYPSAVMMGGNSAALAVDGAGLLLGQSGRWFNLRRDALGPTDPLRAIQTPLRSVGVAAAILLLTVAVGSWWRTKRIESQIDGLRTQQRELFEEAFPKARVPGAILRRVRSEHAKVLGSSTETSTIDAPTAAPDVLQALLAALPNDVRFRITRIQINDGQVDVDLEVRNPVDAGTMADALASSGFEVKPPGTTQKDARTYESVLEATWIGLSTETTTNVSLRSNANAEVAR